MKYVVFGFLTALLFSGCAFTSKERNAELPLGMWRATLSFQETELPFNFMLQKDSNGGLDAVIINDAERLVLDDVTVKGDSVFMPLHIFDASINGRFRNDSLQGVFIKHYDPTNTVPFTAVAGQNFRFKKESNNTVTKDFSGTYSVVFQNEKDTTIAVGIFKQKADSVTGTFLTITGDYRFLQGNVVNDTLKLSAFDGNHAYLFSSVFETKDQLKGWFYSGKTKKSSWIGKLDENAHLPNPDSITTLARGHERINFSFPDVDGKNISLTDPKFKDKVVVLQLLGTWCPNCMDETRFLVPWYNKNASRGVEVIGLAFERKDDFTYASERVKGMAKKMSVSYPLVIAGTNDKAQASTKLPMLNKIASFPTTIFVGKDGKVKKIHTGFSGPGTGKYYDEFIADFNETINTLLAEKTISESNNP